jgi:conjugal transfer pilus assembly protein TraK
MPFSSPKIRTTSSASFEVEGSSIYLSSNAEGQPITAFITEKGSPDLALSMTFVPKRIPPVDLKIKIDAESGGAISRPSKKAKAWEESQPYIQSIRDLLREVANGKTPQGYTLSKTPDLSDFYGCSQPGLAFKFAGGQSVDGHHLKANIGVVQNLSSEVVEFRETSCAGPDVKAVATWPQPMLQPGQRSEVYVVRSVTQSQEQDYNARRSLLQE